MLKINFLTWVVLAFVGSPMVALAQEPLRPSHIKELAKAKFEGSAIDRQALVRAKLEAAQSEYEGREKQYLAGQGTLDILLGSSRRLLDSDREVSRSDSDRIAALERYWQRSLLAEEINRTRAEAGRIPWKEYLITKFHLLGAQIELQRLWWLRDGFRSPVGGRPPSESLPAKDYARAKFEATKADPNDMAQARVEEIAYSVTARYKQFMAGQGTLDILLAESRWWLETELAQSAKPADRLAALERHWELAREVEDVNRARFEAHRIPVQDYLESLYARLDAELQWVQARRALEKPVSVSGPSPLVVQSISEPPFGQSLKERAKAKFEGMQSGPTDLTSAKLDAAREEYPARASQYCAGQGTLDILLTTSRRLFHAERESAQNQASRRTAAEKCWERGIGIESTNRKRFEQRRIPIQDYAESRYFRLKAQLEYQEAMGVLGN
jgi:hypothetical protein